jgi:AcrR family transcriptional regulator
MMKDKTYQSIVDALDLLATAKPARTNGKITAVNLAKEAGIGKASLYRYFEKFPALRQEYQNLRRRGIVVEDVVPETIQQAYRLLKEEVRRLRSELSQVKQGAELTSKLRAHQIQLLWLDNERLRNEVSRLTNEANRGSNVISLTR